VGDESVPAETGSGEAAEEPAAIDDVVETEAEAEEPAGGEEVPEPEAEAEEPGGGEEVPEAEAEEPGGGEEVVETEVEAEAEPEAEEHEPEEHGHEAGEKDHAEENDSLRELLKERFVRIENMDLSMKLLIGTAVTILLASAVLIALRNAHLPTIVGDYTDGETSLVPDVVLLVCLIGFTGAWSLLISAAYRAGWLLRLIALGVFGWAMWDAKDVVTDPQSTIVNVICCVLMGVVLLLGIVSYFPERKIRMAEDRAAAAAALGKGWRLLRHLMPFIIFALLAGATLTAWIGEVRVDDRDFFTTTFSLVLSNHQFVLIPLLVLAGGDFGEWGDFLVGRVARRIAGVSRHWLLAGVTLVVAGAILADGIRISVSSDVQSYGGTLQTELILGGAVVIALPLLMLIAKPSGRWPEKVPFLAVAAVAIVDAAAGFITESHLSDSDPNYGDKIYAISAIIWSIGAALCILVLLSRRGKLRGEYVAAGIFVIMVGITEVLQALPEVGEIIHPFGLNFDNAPYMGVEGIRAAAAIATILVVLYAIATRKVEAWMRPISLTLVALVAIQLLTWIDSLFGATLNETEKTSLLAGIVCVVALTWEFTTSGEAVTNPDTARFSRSTRVFFYVGYVLLVAVSVLYYGDLHAENGGQLLESQFDSEEWVREGILFLGIPIVMAIYVAGIGRWRQCGLAMAGEDRLPLR
jgi:hypothetical protein